MSAETPCTNKDCRRCGKGRQRCKLCGCRSLRGLVRGEGRCLYHWEVHAYGEKWADFNEQLWAHRHCAAGECKVKEQNP